MASVPRVVKNLLKNEIILSDLLDFNGLPIKLSPGVNVDLFNYASDEDLAKSVNLKHLISGGDIQVIFSDVADTQSLTAVFVELQNLQSSVADLQTSKSDKQNKITTVDPSDLNSALALIAELKATINRMNS